MTEQQKTRIGAAREQLQAARLAIGVVAVLAFGGLFAAAKVSHAATGTSSPASTQSVDDTSSDESLFDLGGGAIGPSSGGGVPMGTGSS